MRIRDEIALHAVLILIFYGAYRLGAFDYTAWILCQVGYWVALVMRLIWQMKFDDFMEIDIEEWRSEIWKKEAENV
jgi:hypothetical protein